MSIITKILVVLVALAAVVLTPLLVVYVNNATEIRKLYQDEVSLRVAASQSAATVGTRNTQLLDTINQLNTAIANRDTELRAQASQADLRAQRLQAEINELRTSRQGVESQLARLTATMEEQHKMIDTYAGRIVQSQARNAQLQTNVVEQSRELAAVQTERDVLMRQVRLIQEQNMDLVAQVDELNERIRILTAAHETVADTPIAPTPSVAIRGSVVEVREAAGQVFIALNIGSNDRVEEGMEFIVHSGGTFLGNAVVSRVDRNQASGVMTLVTGPIQVGSQVLAGN